MRTVHFSDARNNLKAVIDQAIDDHDAVLITRRDAPNAVIMSQEQYDSWMETMCQRDPFEGIGKPEPLKGNLAGAWSRRIDDANRFVYTADDDAVYIAACRYHYGDK